MVSMNRLNSEVRAQVIRCLADGNSIRATVRITGVAKNTVTKLLVQAGAICAEYQERVFRNLGCRRLQCNEIWSFVGAKDKNVPKEERDRFGIGSVWTFTAIDADSKLIPCWLVGPLDIGAATEFMQDLAGRLAHRVQLTTDGLKAYLTAVKDSFGADIDYSVLVKLYGEERIEEKRYSLAVCIGCKKTKVIGDPDLAQVSTSYIERQNPTMRMSMRRFTRPTNGFSKKLENHMAALALYFMYYNFVRIHQTLRVTPAMQAGASGKLWSVYDIVALVEAVEKSN
jgi:IS1 family transposase